MVQTSTSPTQQNAPPQSTATRSVFNHKRLINMSNPQIDIISGFCAGIVSNIVSHPLDTIKVRMQVGSTHSLKLVPTVQSIYQAEGIRGFFKGVLSPIMGRAPISAILFTALGYARRKLEKRKDLSENQRQFLAGAFAGFCYTNIAFMFDLLKTRAQVTKYKTMSYRNIQRGNSMKQYYTPVSEAIYLHKSPNQSQALKISLERSCHLCQVREVEVYHINEQGHLFFQFYVSFCIFSICLCLMPSPTPSSAVLTSTPMQFTLRQPQLQLDV